MPRITNAFTRSSCLVLAVAALHAPLQAQDTSDDSFQLGVEIDVRHDSNVSNVSPDDAELRGITQSDQIITPSAFMAFDRGFGDTRLRGSASVGYDIYMENSQLNAERIQAELSALTRVVVCDIEPGASFQRRQAELGDRFLVVDPDGTTDNVQTVQEYRVDVRCGKEIGLRAIGGVSYQSGKNSNEFREFSDYDSFVYTAGVGYEHPSVGTVEVYAAHEETEYENRIVNGIQDRYDVRRFGGSFERDIGANLSGRIEGFFIDLETPGGVGSEFQGAGWDFDLSATLGPRVKAGINLGRDVQPVLNNEALYSKAKTWGGDLSYAMSETISANLAYSMRERDYVYSELTPPSDIAPLLGDTLHLIRGSIDYQSEGGLGGSLYGGYENRDANDDFYDYDGFFVGLKLRYILAR